MKFKNHVLLLIILVALFQSVTQAQSKKDKYIIVGYIGVHGWTGKDIKAGQMTHMIYAFAHLIQTGVLAPASVKDSTNLLTLDSVRTANPGMKVLISVGGWGGCRYFSDASLTDSSRARFINSALAFITKFKLDGIDIDWEYPGQIGANNIFRPVDKENFTLLMRDFRKALDKQDAADHHGKYLLTAATGVDTVYMSHTDITGMQQYVDFINLMTYDIYNGNDHVTGHQSPLYQSAVGKQERVSTAEAIENYMAEGVPAEKIVMGLPFYCRGWTDVNNADEGLYQPSAGHHVSFSYDSLATAYINKNGYEYHWDKKAKVPYLWNSELRTFITYNDERAFKYKVQYMKKHHLGGVMFWEYSLDIKNQVLLNKVDELVGN
ncbi:glycoside hydrolase family 18 protein [Mucilaginibacter sp.]